MQTDTIGGIDMTIWGDRFFALLCSAGAAYMIYAAWDFPANGEIFPLFIGGAIIFVSVLMVIRTVLSPGVYAAAMARVDVPALVRPLAITAATVAYVLLIFQLGYFTTSALFMALLAYAVGVRSAKTIALTAIVTFPLLYAFFELFLNAQLPRGILI